VLLLVLAFSFLPRQGNPHQVSAATADVSVVERIGVAHAPELRLSTLVGVRELIGVRDVASMTPPVVVSLTERIGVTDASWVVPPIQLVLQEQIGLADGTVVRRPMVIEFSERLGVGDSPILLPSLFISLGERIGVIDSESLTGAVVIEVAERMGLSDAPRLAPSTFIELSERVGVLDESLFNLSTFILLGERIGVGAGSRLAGPTVIDLLERVGVSDRPALKPSAFLALAEQVGVGESLMAAPPGDGDGIAEGIDGAWDGSLFIDDSEVFSASFTDQHLGGSTFGVIADRAGLLVAVEDSEIPSEGVVVRASSGAGVGPAELTVCAEAYTVLIAAERRGTLTCGSLTLRVVEGPIAIALDGGDVVTVPSAAAVMIEELGDGLVQVSTIENTNADGDEVTVAVDGGEVVLPLGQELTTDSVPADVDACLGLAGPLERQGCPFGDEIHVDLVTVDQARVGVCPHDAGSCRAPLGGVQVRVFEREALGGGGKRKQEDDYATIFSDADPGGPGPYAIAECVTDASGVCVAGEEAPGAYLVIARYDDGTDVAFVGTPKDPEDFDASGIARKDLQFIQVLRRAEERQYTYPFVFSSNSAWAVNLCVAASDDVEIDGVWSASQGLEPGETCVDVSVVGGSAREVTFDVTRSGNELPQLVATLRVVGPSGSEQVRTVEVPGVAAPTPGGRVWPAVVTVFAAVFLMLTLAAARRATNSRRARSTGDV
jgi:hypothetical protein